MHRQLFPSRRRLVFTGLFLHVWAAANGVISAAPQDDRRLAPPQVAAGWVRPASAKDAQPVWGHAEGLRIAIAPLPGPRGLLRVYAPYLGQPERVMINFIAIEPVRAGEESRGLSELEFSQLDGVRGKRFWSADDLTNVSPRDPASPARGVLESIDGVECLRVFVVAEPFENGAKTAVRLTFRADCPYEVGIATFCYGDSVALEHCIVTATMGNYARLRELHLLNGVVTPTELWPDYRGEDFTPHASFPLAELQRTADGDAIVVATSDETQPHLAKYHPSTNKHWRYIGKLAKQSWRMPNPPAELKALVNGRRVYWGSRSPIPGGVSYENFELVAPFETGGEFWFGVEPLAAAPPVSTSDGQ